MTGSPRVLMISKAAVVGIYQRKLEDIARLGVDLTVVVPPSWRDERGEQHLERVYTQGYRLEILPIRLNGSFHLHTYAGLGRLFREAAPQIVHIDEEPYNAAAWQAYFHARRARAKTVVFSWQNILRRYPPPFSWGERWVLGGSSALSAGTQSAAEVWRASPRQDGRVAAMEKTNARHLPHDSFLRPFAHFDLVVADCSFISLRKILPPAVALLKPDGKIVALIKPQFEAGKAEVDRGAGVIRDPVIHERVLRELQEVVTAQSGLMWRRVTESPLLGPAGNKEFLVLIEKSG